MRFDPVSSEQASDISAARVRWATAAGGMRVDDLARVPLSFPTYAGILVNAAASAADQLNLEIGWQAHQVESRSAPIRWPISSAPVSAVPAA
jgi:dihydrolipoamide dehydrogenase